MAKKFFKWYLHDNAEYSEKVEYLTDDGFSQEDAEKAAENMPFYEVEFNCLFDTETGEVTFTLAPDQS